MATGMVFCACYVTLFFLEMDLARLIGKRRWMRGWGIGLSDVIEVVESEVELEGLYRRVDVEDDGDVNRELP